MMILGTTYIIGCISPYIASYYRVPTSEVLLLLPTKIFLQTLISPIGGKLANWVQPRLLITIGAVSYLGSLYMASQVPRDSFKTFFAVFVGGQAICLGLTYMVPIKIGWRTFPHRSGLVSGIVIGGFGLGALIFN